MGNLIYNALYSLFGDSIIGEVSDFVGIVMNGLKSVFDDPNVSPYFTMFLAVAGSLMIIFFFIDLTDAASKDMITLERLVVSFIKLFVCFAMLYFLPDIIKGLFAMVNEIYNMVSEIGRESINYGVTFFETEGWSSDTFPSSKWVEENVTFTGFDGKFNKILSANFFAVIISLLVGGVGYVARAVACLVVVSNGVALITRAFFSPIAVAQCFEDGSKSTAIKFLKKFAADGLTFAIVLGVLLAVSLLQGKIGASVLAGSNITDINGETAVEMISNAKVVAMIIAVNFSALGAMMKANGIAQDIVGAH